MRAKLMKILNNILMKTTAYLPLVAMLAGVSLLFAGCSRQEVKKGDNTLLKAADDAISLGNFDEAISTLEKAIALNPNEPRAYLKLGLIYEKIKLDPSAAKEYYKKYLEIETDETLRNQVDKWLNAIDKAETLSINSGSDEAAGLVRLALQQTRIEQESVIAGLKEGYEKEINSLRAKLAGAAKKGENGIDISVNDYSKQGVISDPTLEQLKKRIKELESDITVARENDSNHIERFAAAQIALDEEKAKYAELENKFFEFEKNYRAALARINEMTGEKVTDDKLPAAEKELADARKKIGELQQHLIKAKNDSAIIETDMQKLKEENRKLKAEKNTSVSPNPAAKGSTSLTKSKTKTDVPGIKEISGNTIFYVVQQGDTLSRIAEKFYGDKQKWNYIFNMNRDLLKNQNDIKVGDTVKVPILK